MNIKKVETNKEQNLYYHTTNVKSRRKCAHLRKNILNLYPDITYQTFYGFGGAITEASGFCYSKLTNEKKAEFIKDYFITNNYSLCRIPVGSCDFSLKPYSYSKKRNLADFSIKKDLNYIIPLIKDAQKANPNLKFIAAPWSPPAFMKNIKLLRFGGRLLNKYKSLYANYIVKFIKAYENLEIPIDYITIQNEMEAAQIWESCKFSVPQEADFIVNYLYPAFQKCNITTKILLYDYNKDKLFERANESFSIPELHKIASGMAFHWYTGNHFENIALCREKFPDKLLFHTEGCFGFTPDRPYENEYAHDIVEDLNSGTNGYIDWNILLDSKGGPSHVKNYCNSPIRLTSENDNYEKNITYYYIGHFSRYIKPGATRIALSRYQCDIKMTAFKNIDGSIVVVMLNRENYDIDFNLCINNRAITDKLKHKSIVTYIISEN